MEVNFVSSWRPDAEKFYRKANAQKVAEEIYALGVNEGMTDITQIPAESIVEMARNEETEIHKLFEWNDSVAAEKYRLEQARHIVRDIEIVKIKVGNKMKKMKTPVRMFFNLKGESGYRPTPVIIQNADLHQRLLATAKAELDSFVKKYSTLSELEPLCEHISKFVVKLNKTSA